MESTQFDHIARAMGTATTRRAALRGLAAGLLGSIGVAVGQTEARHRHHHHHKNHDNHRCGAQYAGCNQDNDCCQGLLCKKLTNPRIESTFKGTCAYKRGCGKHKDYCEKNRDCCRNFRCEGKKCKRR